MSIDRYELSGSIDKKRSSLSGDVPASRVITGASAYEIAKANGFVGTEEAWLESLKGRPGDPGNKGDDYVLTPEDKTEIAEMAAELVEVPDVDMIGVVKSVNGISPDENGNVEIAVKDVDLSGYATEQYVQKYAQPKGEYLTAVPDGYAKTEDIPTKPEDIGAQPSGNYALKSEIPSVPVQSVNGKTGAVQLSAADVGARPENWMPSAQEVGALPNTYTPPNQTAEQVGADPKGTATTVVSQHNTADDSHNDIRLELKAINDRLTAFFDSDDQTLDELSEIVAYITSNKSLIDSITTSKVSVADIVNNLTSNVTNKPLSAAQGVALKALIDAITIPTKLSQLTNDEGFITGYTETDPTVPSWAKASSKPSYSKSEVGLGNVDNVKQYSASNPPPYPVTSVNGETGAVTLDASAVGARPDTWTPTAANVGAVPTSRTINGKKLSSNITLDASDVGAVPTTQTITVTGVDADGVSHSWTMYGVAQ